MRRLLAGVLAIVLVAPEIFAASVPTKNKFIGAIQQDTGLMCANSGATNTQWTMKPCTESTDTVADCTTGNLFNLTESTGDRMTARCLNPSGTTFDYSSFKFFVNDGVTYATTPVSTQAWRGLDINGTIAVTNGVTGGGAACGGTEIVTDGGFETWTTTEDLTSWYENRHNLTTRDSTHVAVGTYAARLDANGADRGTLESRPGHHDSGRGTLYFEVTTGQTYTLKFRSKYDGAGSAVNLSWSLGLYTSSGATSSSFYAHGTSGVFDGFAVGDVASQTDTSLPGVTLTSSYQQFTQSFTVSGSGVSGTYWAALYFHKRDASTLSAALLDDVSFCVPGDALDATALMVRALTLDQSSFSPVVSASDTASIGTYVGADLTSRIAPNLGAGAMVTQNNAIGVRAGVPYTADADSTYTLAQASSLVAQKPEVGTQRYAGLFNWVTGWDQDADGSGVTCIADDEATDRLFPDFDCDGTIDAGEGWSTGSGTTDYLARWTSSTVLGIGTVTDDATTATSTKRRAITPISSGTLSTDQNDYSVGDTTWSRLTVSAVAEILINGFSGGTSGRELWVTCVGTAPGNITFAHEAAGSSAANRITTTDGSEVIMRPGESAKFIYDGTTSRWRMVARPDGTFGQGRVNRSAYWALGSGYTRYLSDESPLAFLDGDADGTLEGLSIDGDQDGSLSILGQDDTLGFTVDGNGDGTFDLSIGSGLGFPSIAPVADIGATLGEQGKRFYHAHIGGHIVTGDSEFIVDTNGASGSSTRLIITSGADDAEVRITEPATLGGNYVAFATPALASNRLCTFQDAAAPIPDSCVGDGADAGITGLTADAGGTTTGAVVTLTGGTGVDTLRASDVVTHALDTTEVTPSTTWGAGSFTHLAFDAGATDPRLVVASAVIGLDQDGDANSNIIANASGVSLNPSDDGSAEWSQTTLGAVSQAHAPAVTSGTSYAITQALPTGNYSGAGIIGVSVAASTASTGPAGACVGGSNPGTACSVQATCTGGGQCQDNSNSGIYAGLQFSTAGIKGIWQNVYPINVAFNTAGAPYVDEAAGAYIGVSLTDAGQTDRVGGVSILFDDTLAGAAITTNLVYGVNIGAGSFGYGVGSAPITGIRMEDNSAGSTNVKDLAGSHGISILDGKPYAWGAALDTALASASTSWIGTTDGTSRTIKAEGAIVVDSCSDTASASSIAVNSCNKVTLTGSTTVNTITACGAANNGRVLYVLCGAYTGTICDEVVDGVTCGAAGNLRLTATLVCTADDTLTLMCDGTNWVELSRGVN